MAVTVDLAHPRAGRGGWADSPLATRRARHARRVRRARAERRRAHRRRKPTRSSTCSSAHAATDRVAFRRRRERRRTTPTGRASGWTSAPDIFAAYERVVGLPDGAAGAAATGVDALRGGADNATTAATALGLSSDALVGTRRRERAGAVAGARDDARAVSRHRRRGARHPVAAADRDRSRSTSICSTVSTPSSRSRRSTWLRSSAVAGRCRCSGSAGNRTGCCPSCRLPGGARARARTSCRTS